MRLPEGGLGGEVMEIHGRSTGLSLRESLSETWQSTRDDGLPQSASLLRNDRNFCAASVNQLKLRQHGENPQQILDPIAARRGTDDFFGEIALRRRGRPA